MEFSVKAGINRVAVSVGLQPKTTWEDITETRMRHIKLAAESGLLATGVTAATLAGAFAGPACRPVSARASDGAKEAALVECYARPIKSMLDSVTFYGSPVYGITEDHAIKGQDGVPGWEVSAFSGYDDKTYVLKVFDRGGDPNVPASQRFLMTWASNDGQGNSAGDQHTSAQPDSDWFTKD